MQFFALAVSLAAASLNAAQAQQEAPLGGSQSADPVNGDNPNSQNQTGGDRMPVSIKDYPHHVGIEDRAQHFLCSGSILTIEWILTAAHCLMDKSEDIVWVIRAGSDVRGQGGETKEARSVHIHPRFRWILNTGTHRMMDFDVAMIRLEGFLYINDNCKPIHIAEEYQVFGPGQTAWLTGFGNTRHEEKEPRTLLASAAAIWDLRECEDTYSDVGPITDRMLCAGQLGHTGCQGDGGPLIMPSPKDGTPLQIGINSFGVECGNAGYPDVYVSLNHHLINKFIHHLLAGTEYLENPS